jgi:hypothetical protein
MTLEVTADGYRLKAGRGEPLWFADSLLTYKTTGRQTAEHLALAECRAPRDADRGMPGTFDGAVLANGGAYCPATPRDLLTSSTLKKGADQSETAAHDARCEEIARYKLSPLTKEGPDGYRRVACPAAAGKVRCPLRPESLMLSAERPTVALPPVHRPRCCEQASITLPPPVNAKTRQRHDFGSPAHRRSYNRRTAAERTFASMSDVSAGGIRGGWSRLFGIAKNTVTYARAVVARNVRILASFEANRRRRPTRRSKSRPGGGSGATNNQHRRPVHPRDGYEAANGSGNAAPRGARRLRGGPPQAWRAHDDSRHPPRNWKQALRPLGDTRDSKTPHSKGLL